MVTAYDEREGLVKTYWEDIRDRVRKVNAEFAEIVDSLSPNRSYPVYLAYYPYGEMIGDTVDVFIPKIDGGSYRLNDQAIPEDIKKNLGYGIGSSPFSILLEKKLEYYIELKELGMIIPWQIFSPGTFFPLARILQTRSKRIYSPNGLLTVVSGARSVFMLPKIGCFTNHLTLKRNYNIRSQPPKYLYDHWHLFKEIVNSDQSRSQWRSCVLFFSKKWVEKINNEKSWYQLKKYLLEIAWSNFEYARNQIYHNIAYSLIQYRRNLKPNPYLVDTARHLLSIAVGAFPGYAPAVSNDSMPMDVLQEAFVNSYGLKKYIPTIMEPKIFYIEDSSSTPVYYSLQCPSTISFSPRSRKLSSTLFEMRELNHIMETFISELMQESNILSDTIIRIIAQKVDFKFFHNIIDPYNTIKHSNRISKYDDRFTIKSTSKAAKNSVFACDAPFVRGCIRIGLK